MKESVAMRSELHKVRKDFSHIPARVAFEVTRNRACESDGEVILETNTISIGFEYLYGHPHSL